MLVVDGHSTDATRQAAQQAGAEVILDNGKGKGAGMRLAAELAKGDIIVFIDGDGSHEPNDIQKLVQPIIEGKAHIVVASRLRGGSDEFHGTLSNLIRMFGGAMISLAIHMRWKIEVTDCENGYRAIRKDVFQQLKLKRDDFVIEQEMVIKALKRGCRLVEIASHEYERAAGVSKLSTFQGWMFIWHLFTELF